MSENVLLWVLSGLNAIQFGAIIWLINALREHEKTCTENAAKLATLQTQMVRVIVDIGDHESGIRGEAHSQANALTRHEMDIALLKDRLEDER